MFIEGHTVSLREVRKEDLNLFQEYRNVYDDSKNYRTWKPLTSWNQEWYWNNVINSDNHVVFAIIEKSSLKIVGECRISYIDWMRRKGEVGILIGGLYRGKGYAEEALRLLFDFAFNRMNLHRLEAQVDIQNTASSTLFSSLGFVQEGIIREANYYDGSYHDILIFGLLDREFIGH